MGIKIINSFELNSPLPLDARAVANNINEMNELITKNFVVAGQMCYNKADNKLYVLKKNSEGALLSWHEIADSVDLDNINKVLPTDIAVKDNKLGLEHDNVWLTNQNAINLGDNMTYDATTKTLNAKGGGGGESVSPTLYLFDFENGQRTAITEQEKINLEKGLYNQVVYISGAGQSFMIYTPSKLMSIEGMHVFATMDGIVQKGEQVSCTTITMYSLNIGEKNTSGEYPITIESFETINLGNGGSGGSSYTPLELTASDFVDNGRYTVDLTDEQYSAFIASIISKEPIIAWFKINDNSSIPISLGTTNTYDVEAGGKETQYSGIGSNATFEYSSELKLTNNYNWVLKDIKVNEQTVHRLYVDSTRAFDSEWGLYDDGVYGKNHSFAFTKKIALYRQGYSVYVSNIDDEPLMEVNGTPANFYADTINGKKILHTDPTINNYDLGKSINLFGKHSILVPNASTDTNINLYNHFIKITGTKDTTQVIARFTIQSSNNLVVDSLTDLYTLLGNEFEIGCSGLFGENNLTGLRKTTEGVLELIYNNAGAESLQSVADLTISISDKVKTV